jgi:hypothetical protein
LGIKIGYQRIPLIIKRQISLFETKVVGSPGFCSVCIGVIIEIETHSQQFSSIHFRFIGGIEFHQYITILHQRTVYLFNVGGIAALLVVMESVTTLIVTEFLIKSAKHFTRTIETLSLHGDKYKRFFENNSLFCSKLLTGDNNEAII